MHMKNIMNRINSYNKWVKMNMKNIKTRIMTQAKVKHASWLQQEDHDKHDAHHDKDREL
jgi:hypothetical protein